ncbi:MAG: DUF5615 family PIN-like protein [Gammaproteobacteria bacterium]
MKPLFDENLSPRLATLLNDVFPQSVHVDRLGLGSARDSSVWEYAKANGYLIVSKDSDFHERTLLNGHPPKVVWIKRGNCSTRQVEALLRQAVGDILAMAGDPQFAFPILL